MVKFNFNFDLNVSLEQRVGFEMAAAIWSSFLKDSVTVNLNIGAVSTLGENGQAVGGAVPVFHETHYGVYQEYLERDATSEADALVLSALQEGNTVDLLVDTDSNTATAAELIDGNTEVMLTRAQAKALGMEDPLILDNGTVWDRDVLQNPTATDGYILINNAYNWHYDLTRKADAPEQTLDFLTMALHEIGHTLGFVSGLDGLVNTFNLYSGEQRTEGFTPLDLMRYSETSAQIQNPDGSVSELSFGGSAYFSIDGGKTSMADFEAGDQYQASHWKRFRNAIGIMDPTLGYKERTNISKLDLTAFDAIGWDINYNAFASGLNLDALYSSALKKTGGDVNAVIAALTQGKDWQTLGYEAWFNSFKEQILAQGWATWFEGYDSPILEQGWGTWFQAFRTQMLEQGWGTWFQELKNQMLQQGWGTELQEIEPQMLAQGWGSWFQAFEDHLLKQLWGTWFQTFGDQLLNQLWGTWFQDFKGEVLTQGWGTWFQNFQSQVLTQGWGSWFQNFEGQMLSQKWGSWFQKLDQPTLNQKWGTWFQEFKGEVLHQGWGTWFQNFESKAFQQRWGTWFLQNEPELLKQGWGTWFQKIDQQLLQQGWGTWFQKFENQVLEKGWGTWFQNLDPFLETLNAADNTVANVQVALGGVGGAHASVHQGGTNDDIIAGDQKQDRIKGGAGDDLIDGKGGHDVIWGELGNDILYGQSGNDLMYGGDSDDLIFGEADNDELYGEQGNDIVDGGNGDDIVSGGSGKDDLKGGWGRDVIAGDEGDDRLQGEANNDILIGGAGRDQALGGSGSDRIYGDNLPEGEVATLAALRKQLQQQPIDGSATSPTDASTAPYNPIRVEAEAMTWTGDYQIHTSFNNDSGDSVKTNSTATAATTFTGKSGKYLIVARYFDKSAGQGSFAVTFNGSLLNSWTLDQDDSRYYTRTIAQSIDLKAGDQFKITATANGSDPAYLDYLEFVPLDNLIVTELDSTVASTTSTVTNTTNTVTNTATNTVNNLTTVKAVNGTTLRVEAESMALVGDYYLASNLSASGGKLIEISNQGQGKALTAFKGATGLYNIVVGYYDQYADGVAQMSTKLNGVLLDSWQLDRPWSLNTFTTRTVASGVILSTGDIFEVAGLRGEGSLLDETAQIDYIEFVKLDASTVGGSSATPTVPTAPTPAAIGAPIRIEAEAMSLNGYTKKSEPIASNGGLIETLTQGTAITSFTGKTGYYNIAVTYHDESDGISTLSTSLNGIELASWQLDQGLNENLVSARNRVTRTVATQVQVKTGDVLQLKGNLHNSEFARIDYIELIPVAAPAIQPSEIDDVLQGDAGDDVILGGEGNDLIYGESKDYVGNVSQGSYNDILVGDAGDDIIYGNIGNDLLYGDFLNDSALTNGLIGNWALNETYGLTANDSTKNNPGTLTNMTASQWTTGQKGGALTFDNNNDRVIVANSAALNMANTLTLATWVKADAPSLLASLVNERDGLILKGTSNIAYGLQLNSNGRLTFSANRGTLSGAVGSGNWSSNAQLAAQKWHHVAVTYDGSEVRFYINGALDSSYRASLTFGTNTEALVLGADLSAGGSHFGGALDDVRVYNRSLTSSEIGQLVNSDNKSLTTTETGNDVLSGGSGNDTLRGGGGNDTLNGTDAIAVGRLEQDTLTGGLGADKFVLGDARSAYYLGNGNLDYALIKDFNPTEDVVLLNGSAAKYTQQKQGNSTYLFYQGSQVDLVAIFENRAGVNFSSGFTFA